MSRGSAGSCSWNLDERMVIAGRVPLPMLFREWASIAASPEKSSSEIAIRSDLTSDSSSRIGSYMERVSGGRHGRRSSPSAGGLAEPGRLRLGHFVFQLGEQGRGLLHLPTPH